VLQLCNKFGRESSVAIADQSKVIPETCQFSRLSDRVATECTSFGDKALDCGGCSESQALVLVGVLLANLRVGFLCRVAHEPTLFRSLKLCSARAISTRFRELVKSQQQEIPNGVNHTLSAAKKLAQISLASACNGVRETERLKDIALRALG
jgi:hypothetical protein